MREAIIVSAAQRVDSDQQKSVDVYRIATKAMMGAGAVVEVHQVALRSTCGPFSTDRCDRSKQRMCII
jgi:hypothetical protein